MLEIKSCVNPFSILYLVETIINTEESKNGIKILFQIWILVIHGQTVHAIKKCHRVNVVENLNCFKKGDIRFEQSLTV